MVALLIDHLLQEIGIDPELIVENDVVNWTSRTLDCNMGAEVEVPVERMSSIALNQRTRERVRIAVGCSSIARLREESDMVTLSSDDNRDFRCLIVKLFEATLQSRNFFLDDTFELTVRYAIPEEINMSGIGAIDLDPVFEESQE